MTMGARGQQRVLAVNKGGLRVKGVFPPVALYSLDNIS